MSLVTLFARVCICAWAHMRIDNGSAIVHHVIESTNEIAVFKADLIPGNQRRYDRVKRSTN